MAVQPAEATLKRNEVGLFVGISTSAGLVIGQLTFVTIGFGIGTMGPAFLLAMLTALVVSYLQAFSFSELSMMYPKAGSLFDYVAAGLGPVLGTMAAFAGYVMIAVFSGSAELQVAGLLIRDTLIGGTEWWIWALAMAGLLVALAFFLYIGFEYVCPLVEEIRNPRRNIPLAMFTGLLLVFIGHSLFGLAASRWVPLDDLAESATPHVLFADTIFGGAGKWVIGVIGLTASLSSMNSLYAAAPRILYGMGKDGYLPRIFSWVHPRFRTPTFSILFIVAASVIPLAAGTGSRTILLFILGSVFAWIVAYALIHLSVLSLRLRRPGLRRPYRTPLFPVPQVLGLAALGYMITKISPDPSLTRDTYLYGGGLLAVGIVYSIGWGLLQRRRLELLPTPELEQVEEPPALGTS